MNRNFLIIVIAITIIAVGAVGFIFGKYYSDVSKKATEIYESGLDAGEVAEKETEECASIENISEKNQCWTDLAKETKDENHCKKISADFPEARGDCYTELAILKDDSLICEKIDSSSLHKSCLEYFEGNDEKDKMANWEIYDSSSAAEISDEMYIIKYPNDWSHKEERAIGTHSLVTFFTDSQKQKKLSITVETTATFIPSDATQIIIKDKTFYKSKEGINYIYKLSSGNLIEFTSWVDENILKKILESFTYQEIENEISDWKTLQSPIMKFSIKYPSEAEVSMDSCVGEHGPILDMCRTYIELPSNWFSEYEFGSSEIIIESWTKFTEEFASFQDYVGNEEKTFREHYLKLGMFSEVKEETIALDNVLAKKFLILSKIKYDHRVIDIYVQHKKRMYHIIGSANLKNEDIYLPIFNQILSTFKFTN
jgi:hypothetical protein